jgi:hypothetical protein
VISWPKQPTTPNKHAQTQTSIIKQEMTNATLLLTQMTPNDCGIRRGSGCSLWAPCPNSGLRRWLSRCLCLTCRGRWPDSLPSSCSLRWWRLHSAARCGESRSRAERLVDAQLHRHILVVYHLYPGDILLYPVGLELIPLPVGQEVVDRVLQPMLVSTNPRCDGLPGGNSNSIAVRGPESWSLVTVEDSGSKETLCDGFELHPPWMRDFLDPIPRSGGDAQVFQQSSKPTGENWSFDPEGLHLISISVHLLIVSVARGRVLFVSLVFYILVLRLLLLLSRRVLRRWALRSHQLYLKRFLFL